MKYKIIFLTSMRRSAKLMQKRGKNMKKLEETIRILSSGEILPERYLDHPLSGNYKGYRECHIEPDWLLIYKIDNNTLTLVLSVTGTHSDLF